MNPNTLCFITFYNICNIHISSSRSPVLFGMNIYTLFGGTTSDRTTTTTKNELKLEKSNSIRCESNGNNLCTYSIICSIRIYSFYRSNMDFYNLWKLLKYNFKCILSVRLRRAKINFQHFIFNRVRVVSIN